MGGGGNRSRLCTPPMMPTQTAQGPTIPFYVSDCPFLCVGVSPFAYVSLFLRLQFLIPCVHNMILIIFSLAPSLDFLCPICKSIPKIVHSFLSTYLAWAWILKSQRGGVANLGPQCSLIAYHLLIWSFMEKGRCNVFLLCANRHFQNP